MDTLFRKQKQLSQRIRKNFNDYKADMLKTNRQHIFDNAPEIIANQFCRYMSHVSQYDKQSLNQGLRHCGHLSPAVPNRWAALQAMPIIPRWKTAPVP